MQNFKYIIPFEHTPFMTELTITNVRTNGKQGDARYGDTLASLVLNNPRASVQDLPDEVTFTDESFTELIDRVAKWHNRLDEAYRAKYPEDKSIHLHELSDTTEDRFEDTGYYTDALVTTIYFLENLFRLADAGDALIVNQLA